MTLTNMSASSDWVLKKVLPKKWGVICLINLLLTALIGLGMRYKIAYSFRALDQANALHAHANFVFSGWVGLTLFSGIVSFVLPSEKSGRKTYAAIFWLMELASLGMLVSFLIQGYGIYSIGFIAISALAGILFIVNIWKDLRYTADPVIVRMFLKGAFLWYLLSLCGTAALVYMDYSGKGSPIEIRAAFYFFLHFQYNGWFTFCIFGLLLNWLYSIHRPLKSKAIHAVFWLLVIGLIPGYFLSILAFYPTITVEIPSIISVLTYFIAAVLLFKIIVEIYPRLRSSTPKHVSLLWKIATLSFFLKTLMQAATLVPSLAAFAFSFRPLIIGFLHLTFLCFVTFFLIGYLIYFRQLQCNRNRLSGLGLFLFVVTVILSEIALFAHAFFAFIGIYLSFFTEITFEVTIGIFLGLILFILGQFKNSKTKLPTVEDKL